MTENQIKGKRLIEIMDNINSFYKIIDKPIISAFMSLKILNCYTWNLEKIELRLKELNELAGKQDISNSQKGFEFIALFFLFKHKIYHKW